MREIIYFYKSKVLSGNNALALACVVALYSLWYSANVMAEEQSPIALLRQGHYAELELRMADYQATYERGSVYQSLGEMGKAIADYSRAIEMEPISSSGYVSRGSVYQAMKDLPSAFTDFDRATQLNPKNANAWMYRGSIYWSQGKPREAADDYDRASQLGSAWAQNELAKMLWAGRGVPVDKKKAWALWEQSAEQGNVEAKTSLKEARDYR